MFDHMSYDASIKEIYTSDAPNKHELISNIEKKFKHDLEIYFEVDKCSEEKKNKLYSIAYEYGHSEGFYSVYSYYSDLYELII